MISRPERYGSTADGTYNYTYDAEGNRTQRTKIATGDITDYQWDYRNRLTRVTFKTSAGVVTKQIDYTYDVLDRRIASSLDPDGSGPAAAVVTRFLHESDGWG